MELLVLPARLPADISGIVKLFLPNYSAGREGRGQLVDWSVRAACSDTMGGNRLIVSIHFVLVYRHGNYVLPSPLWPYGRSGWIPNTGDYRTEDYLCWASGYSTRLSYFAEGDYIESERNV